MKQLNSQLPTGNAFCQNCPVKGRSILHFCTLNELDNISSQKTCRAYKAGQSIFHEGIMAAGLYCLSEGKIKIHKESSDGKTKIIRLVKPGDPIGYRSLISSQPYSVSATALTDIKVCFIPRKVFFDTLRANKNLSHGLTQLLCTNLNETESKLTKMAYKPVRERLAEALLYIKTVFEEQENGPFTFDLPRNDLAGLVGTAKETLIRSMAGFKADNIIKVDGRAITILQPDELLKISQMYD